MIKARNNNILNVVYMCRYINGVKPGEYGVRLPFYFPCLPSYWLGTRSKAIEVRGVSDLSHVNANLNN